MMHHGGYLLVDAGLADDAVGDDAIGKPQHERCELHRIDPEVEQPSPTKLQIEMPVPWIHGNAEPEVCFHEQRLTDASVREYVSDGSIRREEAAPHRLHEEHAGVAGCGDHAFGFACVHGEGLLAQD